MGRHDPEAGGVANKGPPVRQMCHRRRIPTTRIRARLPRMRADSPARDREDTLFERGSVQPLIDPLQSVEHTVEAATKLGTQTRVFPPGDRI